MARSRRRENKKKRRQVCECSRHGAGEARYVCSHLFQEGPKGLNGTDPDEDGVVEAMWCDSCEYVYTAERGEWNDRVMENMDLRLVCHRCFAEVRRNHFRVVGSPRTSVAIGRRGW